jgi:hypothetical protein
MTAADQIRALADTGTPADRWRIRQGRGGSNWIEAGEYDEVLQPAPVTCMAYCYGGSSQIELSDEDAAKIVAAVNALPALADLIDAVGTHRKRARLTACAVCDFPWPCPTTAARDALVEALGVTA